MSQTSTMSPSPPNATTRLPTHGVSYRDTFANALGTSPSRPRAKKPRPMRTQIASASAIASRITTSSSRVANQEPTYSVAISLTGPGENAQAPSETASLPYPIENAKAISTKKAPAAPTVQSTARGIE